MSDNNDDRAGFSGDYFLPELFDSGERVPMAFPDPLLIQVPQSYQTDTIQVKFHILEQSGDMHLHVS